MEANLGTAAGNDAPQQLNVRAYGVAFRLECTPALGPDELAALLPHGSAAAADVPPDAALFSLPGNASGTFRVQRDGVETGRFRTLAEAHARLAGDLMVHVADRAPDRVFVHAGVVALGGRALVLPGPSFAGKTTLVAALVRAGATYYSDEYAVLDAEGLCHPYARALQMRELGRPQQRGVTVETLGGRAGLEAVPVAMVVFAHYAAGARWQPQPLSHGLAALETMRHAIAVQRSPARVMHTFERMLAGATAWQTERGDADEAGHALLHGLAGGGF